MGFFGRFRGEVEELGHVVEDALLFRVQGQGAGVLKAQATVVALIVATLLVLRFTTQRRQSMRGPRTLDMSNLNDCANFKEVFLCYLQAALLEPVLAIGGMEKAQDMAVVINLLTMASLCWWLWLITDAFDFGDVMQCFKYSNELRDQRNKDPNKYAWLLMSDVSEDAERERKTLQGSLLRDVGLWFMMASIAAAWLPGAIVTHRDVLHAYVVVILWTILHAFCRRASAWTPSVWSTYFFPSTALMPMEYCLPLMDVADTVEDLEFVVNYREFVYKRTGVELTIRS